MKTTLLKKKILILLLINLAFVLNISIVSAQSIEPDFGNIFISIFTNPSSLITFIIELGLGLGIGYFSVKVFKYLLALIAIFVIGVVLNVWSSPSLGANLKDLLTRIGFESSKIYPILLSIVYLLGLITVLPITVGFIIGLVIAITK